MKKFLTLLVVAAMLLSMSVLVYAEDTFTPTTYKTAKGTATVDGVKDEAYLESDMLTVDKGGLDRPLLDGHATAKVWTLWDEEYLYIYAEVNDTTPGGVPNELSSSWENESVEIYVDYEDNKDMINSVASSTEACQLRICRYPDSYPNITGQGANQAKFAAGTTYKVIDNGENGYIVEASVKHSATTNTGKIGFSLQINDDMNGDTIRDSIVYVDALQKDAWMYTALLDTIELDGFVAPEPIVSEDASSVEETTSVDETSSEETSSADAIEESSQDITLNIESSASPVINEATLDPVITIVVFALAVVAIVVIIILTTKKK